MLLDSIAAKALAMIVLTNTQGVGALHKLPLNVEDHGASWLVKSTPCTDLQTQSRYVTFSIFFRKDSAEIIGIGFEARIMLSAAEERRAKTQLSSADFDRLYGPPHPFEPGGYFFAMNKQMVIALYGGFINSSSAALDYAEVLLHSSKSSYTPPRQTLEAEQRGDVWHIKITQCPGFAPNSEILTFSRSTGKLLSGAL
jgi:hypothetical protein